MEAEKEKKKNAQKDAKRKEREALRSQKFLEMLEARRKLLPTACVRDLLPKNIITTFESGYFLAVHPYPPVVDVLMIFQ